MNIQMDSMAFDLYSDAHGGLHLIIPLTLPYLTCHQGYLHIYSISH